LRHEGVREALYCIYERKTDALSLTIVAVEKQLMQYIMSVCVALVIQHAKRMRSTILPSVVCPAVPYFSTLSNKRHDVKKKVIQYRRYVLSFSTNFV
jgi:hypothetical protein